MSSFGQWVTQVGTSGSREEGGGGDSGKDCQCNQEVHFCSCIQKKREFPLFY